LQCCFWGYWVAEVVNKPRVKSTSGRGQP
jgi:hypothetical protein